MRGRLIAPLVVLAWVFNLPTGCSLDRSGSIAAPPSPGDESSASTTSSTNAGPSVSSGGLVGSTGGQGGSSSSSAPQGGMGGMGGNGGMAGAGGDGAQSCPTGEFVTGITADGTIECANITAATKAAVNEHCSVYFGWSDQCDGCTDDPVKWGRSSSVSCSNPGTGNDNTCTAPTLGSNTVRLFGLNTDGAVNGDDQFYVGMQCTKPDDNPIAGPCAAGSYVSGLTPSGVECVTGHRAIADYVHDKCELYLGWQNTCNGCTTPPNRWGRTSGTTCTNGKGNTHVCITPTLDSTSVLLFGLNPKNSVGDNDTFYVGLRCAGAVASDTSATQTCPSGELLVGLNNDGTVQCSSPALATEAVVQNDCAIYFGWSDSCSGCTDPPFKWGYVNHNSCTNGSGTDNTCLTHMLDSVNVQLFGLNTDGTVGDDDTFYLGLSCP